MTPKGANLEGTDLLEVSTLESGSYVTRSITGQEIIDAAAGSGVTNITVNAPLATTGGTTPDLSISEADGTTDGYLTAVDWSTFNGKQNGLTLTTTGTNGAATLVGDTLNIPQYSGGGGGGFHVPIKPRTGAGYSNNTTSGVTTFGNSANILYLLPFIPANTLTITSAAIQVTTAGAGITMKILVYSDVNGLPTTKLLESSLLDISTIGFKTFTTSYTFNAGTTYWIATIASGASGVIASHSNFMPIGVSTSSNATFNAFSQGGISLASIPATLSLTSGNLANLSSLPRITLISA
jgi:hypothetical protein